MSQQVSLSASLSAFTMALFALLAVAGVFPGQPGQIDIPSPQISASVLAE